MKSILVRPHITEKSLQLAAVGQYTFIVEQESSKGEIAACISDFYSVTVESVQTIRRHGKYRRFGKSRSAKRMPDTKKAMVRLKTGQTIDAFTIVPEQQA